MGQDKVDLVDFKIKQQADEDLIRTFLRIHNEPEPYYNDPEATDEFEFIGFCFGIATVVQKSTGKHGTVRWADGSAALGHGHYGRIYFGFREE